MVKVDDAAGVKVLHHEEVRVVGPVLHLNLALRRFLHTVHEHSAEVFTLGGQNCFVAVYWLLLDEEHHVSEGRVVDYGAHVDDKVRHRLIVYLIFLKFSNIQDAYIVKPFAPIESSENEKLFCSDYARCVSLAASRSFLKFQRVTPSHGLGIEHVEVVGWYYFFETSTPTIITAKQVHFVSYQIGCVTSQAFWRTSTNLGLGPAQGLRIKNVKVF